MGLDQHLTPYTRINSEWVKELNIKKETINKLGEHRIVYLSDLWDGEVFKSKQVRKKLQKVKSVILITLNLKVIVLTKTMKPKLKAKQQIGKQSL